MNNRGGKREGAGRKALSPDLKRVQLSVYIRPETKEKLSVLTETHRIKIGEEVDKLVTDLFNRLVSD